MLKPAVALLRRWDYAAAQRVHHFIAISTEIRERIRRFYHRESTIIYPPADITHFMPSGEPPGDYFLAGGRLIPYKRTDLAVAACSELGLKLLVYGDGRDRAALERMAGPTVTFLGRVSWDDLARLYAGARAFIFPGLEDFGIAPVEAQAAGRPVIAFRGGGALDTVSPAAPVNSSPSRRSSRSSRCWQASIRPRTIRRRAGPTPNGSAPSGSSGSYGNSSPTSCEGRQP